MKLGITKWVRLDVLKSRYMLDHVGIEIINIVKRLARIDEDEAFFQWDPMTHQCGP